jgi:hypothetical protein
MMDGSVEGLFLEVVCRRFGEIRLERVEWTGRQRELSGKVDRESGKNQTRQWLLVYHTSSFFSVLGFIYQKINCG